MADLIKLWENYVENPNSKNFGEFETALNKATVKQLKEFKKKKFKNVKPPDEEEYKDNKNITKNFSKIRVDQMKKLLMEAVKKSPAYTGVSGGDEPPTGGDEPPTGGDKPPTGGDIGEDPETVKKFVGEQVRKITNGEYLKGFSDLKNLMEKTDNDDYIYQKLLDAFNGILGSKDAKESHKYASEWYVGILEKMKEGEKIEQAPFFDIKEYVSLRNKEKKGGKGGDKPPTGGDNPPTGGDKPPTGGDKPPTGGKGGKPPTGGKGGKGGSTGPLGGEENLAKKYVEISLNAIQRDFDTTKLSKEEMEKLADKLAENYVKPYELREDIKDIFKNLVGEKKKEYSYGTGFISGIKKALGGDDHTKTSKKEQDAVDKAIDKLFADKPPVPPEPPTGGGDKPPVKPPPTPVDPLPPIIQPSKIKVEDIQTDLDRYREATKKLRNLIKGMNAEGTQQKIPDFEYDTVRYKLLNGRPMSPDEQQHMNEIRDAKKQIEEYEEGAKKIAKEILEKERRSVTATQRTGLLGPHLANDTTKAVKEQLDKTPEQQIKDISNWYIFDVPSDSTGQGTKIDNPLVAQNEMREKMLLDGATLFTSLSNYTLQEGPFERQDFFHQHPELTRAGIGRGIFEVETEQTKEQFLEKFNDGNNGLFSQDQTREEVSDFQNIYQKPARMIGGADYNFDFTNNRGIKHTDKVWLSNLNLFFDNAPIL